MTKLYSLVQFDYWSVGVPDYINDDCELPKVTHQTKEKKVSEEELLQLIDEIKNDTVKFVMNESGMTEWAKPKGSYEIPPRPKDEIGSVWEFKLFGNGEFTGGPEETYELEVTYVAIRIA